MSQVRNRPDVIVLSSSGNLPQTSEHPTINDLTDKNQVLKA